MGEVTKLLGEDGAKAVIGVHATPSHDTLLKIARLHVPVIAVICELPNTVENLSYIVKTYQPSATILTMLITDERLPGMPQLLEQPQWACASAAWFWHSRGLNQLADRGEFNRITRHINGGLNGLENRLTLWARAREVLC